MVRIYFSDLASALNFNVPDQHFKLTISNGVKERDANLFNSFHFWNITTCDSPYDEHSQYFTVFENGSIFLLNHDITYPEADEGYHICITANVRPLLLTYSYIDTILICRAHCLL
jgi:hypothetical protein